MKRVLFIDRDGTLIEEPKDRQVDDLTKLSLTPDVIPALIRLVEGGYRLVMITNQDGLGGASFPQEKFDQCQNMLLDLLRSQGICFDEVLICPHLPQAGCSCRKPQLGLVVHLLKDPQIDWRQSYLIGDRASDSEMAQSMNIGSFLIASPESPEGATTYSWPEIATLILSEPRRGSAERVSKETTVSVAVDLDQPAPPQISTGIPFFDHMLEQWGHHAGWGLKIQAQGDLEVDHHHTIEDTALCFAQALHQALSHRACIARYGFALPMDEARCEVLVDLARRPYFHFNAEGLQGTVAGIDVGMFQHFFRSFTLELPCNLHIKAAGENTHHIVESMFKAAARAFKGAAALEASGATVPSTKGVL